MFNERSNFTCADNRFPKFQGGAGSYTVLMPNQTNFCSSCSVNTDYDVAPNSFPKRRSLFGSASLKHLYEQDSNYFPYQTKLTPEDSFYGIDTSKTDRAGNLVTYQYMIYPNHSFSGREVQEYYDYDPTRTDLGEHYIGPNGIDMIRLPNVFEWTRHKMSIPR